MKAGIPIIVIIVLILVWWHNTKDEEPVPLDAEPTGFIIEGRKLLV